MNQGLKNIFILLGIAAFAYGLWYIRLILLYIIIAIVVALVCRPLAGLIMKAKIKDWSVPPFLAAALSILILAGMITGFISLLIPLVTQEAQNIAKINPDLLFQSLEGPLGDLRNFLARYQVDSSSLELDSMQKKIASYVGPNLLKNIANTITGAFSQLVLGTFSILFISFFFLKEGRLFERVVFTLTPDEYMNEIQEILKDTKKLLSRYFIGILIQITLISILWLVGLSVFGLKNALLIAFFAGLVNFIPYAGPIIGAAFALSITITGHIDMDFYQEVIPKLYQIGGIAILVQLIDNFVFQPLIFSKSVKAHPLEIFIVILIAGTTGGIFGMILAIPIYTLFRIIAREFLWKFKWVQSLTKDL